ncbi:hypothetical protein DTO013E5_8034 [Penicillium roqueforti]|uniref:Genomic scaffold, ProqFM164S04 n=1 Tax=Penicillium roqueforti (strain FM164) TaxID=1365484 RepID=W6QHL8_PENRF|nr:uncharacterized protein LCP9604111_7677 [Penicillium roqueforti]CDM35486.1 unnamed protein product [Penicillium roqueforti FM164]KAF9243294.1 hypothetical protein LCP9604111_7677 [Penicillium roqueforti]KAI1833834.1 hypothetical protein CBS147337_5389 [Penicillium roqueforti]KAI2685725.1 hypothetical protein CBS147355_1212 [Penicillium roqueforti]KAI2691914.1 hypothetical protein LCP963914a_8 [Penicillium roqueforti]
MGPYVPPGQSPPFEVVDDLHHGAWVIITAALGLVVSLACFLIRLYVRLMLIPPFARDDWILLGATATAVVQSSLIFYACSRGFGTSISLLKDGRLDQIQALIAASDIIALIIIYLSKCCVVAIYLRLTPQKPHNRASWATLALCTAWVIPAIFIVLVNCELNTPWRSDGGQCNDLYIRWQFIAAVDVITELLLFILAVVLLKGLFMSVRRKLAVGFAFIFRFPLIIFSLIHISTLHTALKSKDTTLAAVNPTVWMQVELQYALVACSVFCLRPFMAAVSTNYGTAGDSTLEGSASRSNGTREGSKTGSGSGSNPNTASRSVSHSRMQRKRVGTGSRLPPVPPAVSSQSQQSENHGPGQGAPLCLNTSTHAHRALGNNTRDGYSGSSDTVCPPVRRSMFPLSAPRKKLSFQMLDKGKNGIRAGSGGLFTDESDLIELMPRSHTRHASDATELEDEEGADKMVIHKEIRYSIQYEDEDEAELRRREDLKINSVDVTAYV